MKVVYEVANRFYKFVFLRIQQELLQAFINLKWAWSLKPSTRLTRVMCVWWLWSKFWSLITLSLELIPWRRTLCATLTPSTCSPADGPRLMIFSYTHQEVGYEWTSARSSERTNGRTTERGERTNPRTDERKNGRINERTNNKWPNERINRRTVERTNEPTKKRDKNEQATTMPCIYFCSAVPFQIFTKLRSS